MVDLARTDQWRPGLTDRHAERQKKNRQIATHVCRQTDGQADRNTLPLELTTLGWPIRLVLKQLLWDPPSVNALSFNALIFPILRIVRTISFHYSCPWISSMSCTAFNSPAGKGLTSWLSMVVSTVSLSLSHWYPWSGVVLDCIDS